MRARLLCVVAVVVLVFLATYSFANINVTDKAKLSLASSVFNKSAGTTSNDYGLKNTSTGSLSGPFKVVVESIDNRHLFLTNPDGYTPDGKPYIEYNDSDLGLAETSSPKTWVFDHRCGKRVTVTIKKLIASWNLTFQPTCSNLVTVYVSIFSSEGGANHAPVANAGPDQTVKAGETVYLDGGQSSDPDGDLLTYTWSVISKPEGTKVVLWDPDSVNPSFTARASGSYVFGLMVSDGELTNTRDTCTITTSNSRPVADAGLSQTAMVGDEIYLDGSKSTDVDGNLLKQSWSMISRPEGSTATLTNPNTVRPSFSVDQPGSYILQLIVKHGLKLSYPDFSVISTENSPPQAHAGEDQTITVGSVVELNGSHSTDVDGTLLTYRWSILSMPDGSTAALSAPVSVMPSFTADQSGTYVIQLIVNDGTTDSLPDTVAISTENSRPLADAGDDQTMNVGDEVSIDGSRSTDPDGNPLTYRWAIITKPKGSLARLSDSTSVAPSFIADKDGTYVLQLTVSDGQIRSLPDTVVISTENSRPVADGGADQTVDTGDMVYLDGSGSWDADGDSVNFFWAILYSPERSTATLSDPFQFNPTFIADVQGVYVLQLIVNDGSMDSYPDAVTVSAILRLITVPNVIGFTQATAESAITSPNLVVGAITTAYSDLVPNGNVIDQTPAGGTSVPQGSAVILVISLGSETIIPPPDPDTQAPPIDPTVATTMEQATEFFYTGSNPIQTGVATGTIEARRVAVLRGRVTDREGSALSGVKITILNHPEYGRTISRLDGMFDMAVNGGGLLIVNYEKAGYLSAQRQKDVPWQDYVWLPEVALIPLDTQVTTIDLASGSPIQVARATVQTDSDGTRQATLLFTQGIQAELVMANGSTRSINSLSVRATEYTVGSNGPKAMPAELPKTSGYTYCVEVSADEATASGAASVRFDQPYYFYLDDFIGFPVGSAVPAGYYDKQKGQWVASENGRVIRILSITGGLTDIDTDGDGSADSGLRITDVERQQLANLYPITPKQLWRVPMTHFTPWDCNWPYGPPPDAVGPNQAPPSGDQTEDQFCEQSGSIIECQNQTLGERIPVVGTPFTLNYRSDRVPGRVAARVLDIPVSGASVPASLVRIRLEIEIAGRKFSQTYPPTPNLTYQFTWDGTDAFGRRVYGLQFVTVKTIYEYQPYYYAVPSDLQQAFGRINPSDTTVISRNDGMIQIEQVWRRSIGSFDARGLGLSGWSLDVQHAYDPVDQYLYLGSGERRIAANMGYIIETVAGNGEYCDNGGLCGDGGLATAAPVEPWGVVVAPDGSLIITDNDYMRIRRVGPDGIITTVAGNTNDEWCYVPTAPCGDGGPATQASFGEIYLSALGPDGGIYIADNDTNRIRRVSPDGIINTVVGTGEQGFSGDGGPAVLARLSGPQGVTVGPDGSLYITDSGNNRIRHVGSDGVITTLAGNGSACYPQQNNPCGDDGPATQASLHGPIALLVGKDGTLYFGSNNRVRKVSPDGIVRTVAGTGEWGFSGDGGPATAAILSPIGGLAFAPDGSLLVADIGNHRIRRISSDGIINTIAGSGEGWLSAGFAGDNGFATAAKLHYPWGIAVGPNGHIYIADEYNRRLRRLRPFLPEFTDAGIVIASEDGQNLHLFDSTGRHLRTVNTQTGVVVYEFTYDTNHKLIQITDAYSNDTIIERDGSGNPTAIIGPYGQRTTLTLDANGYLATITNPAGETASFTYTAEGVLTGMTDAGDNASGFTYDALGRLIHDDAPGGSSQALSRSDLANGYEVTQTTALSRSTTYRIENLSTGDKRNVNIFPNGLQAETLYRTDGTHQTLSPDGTLTVGTLGPDPRFGMQAPIAQSFSVSVPSGLSMTTNMTRTVTLSDPNDPLSLQTKNDTVTINGQPFTSSYNGTARRYTTRSPVGREFTTFLNEREEVIELSTLGRSSVRYLYDSTGRMTNIFKGTGGDERVTSFGYGIDGLLNRITDPLNQTHGFTRDAAGRVQAYTFPDSASASYTYDQNGNVLTVIPPDRPAHSYTYTPGGLIGTYTAPVIGSENSTTQYAYNADQQLTLITQPDGKTIAFAYDGSGRLSSMTLQAGAINPTYSPSTGSLTALASPGGVTLDLTYDGFLPTGETWSGPVTGSVTRTYGPAFRMDSISINGSQTIGLEYDQDGLLTQAGSLIISRSTQNDSITGTTLEGMSTTKIYNPFGELVGESSSYNSSTLLDIQYVRDKLGRVTQKTETIQGDTDTYTYTYDVNGRLTEVRNNGATISSYTYDGNGNRTGANLGSPVTGTYDAQDRLTQYGSTTYVYTANGELQTKTEGDQITTYQYDALGNLRQVTLPTGTVISYLIDGRNRRIGKRVDGTLTQGFLYENTLKPIAELDGTNGLRSLFIYGTRANIPDYMVREGNTYRILSDHLGSPRLVVNISTGDIAHRIDYDEFGNVTQDTNPGFQPFGFAGGLYDNQTGLVRFGVRDYDPKVGRWTTKDQEGFSQGFFNRYAYVNADPVNWHDPDGQLRVDASSFPTTAQGQKLLDKVRSALNRLTGEKGQGDKWKSVPKKLKGEKDLLAENYKEIWDKTVIRYDANECGAGVGPGENGERVITLGPLFEKEKWKVMDLEKVILHEYLHPALKPGLRMGESFEHGTIDQIIKYDLRYPGAPNPAVGLI
jgi:RHS repeat-associated protein